MPKVASKSKVYQLIETKNANVEHLDNMNTYRTYPRGYRDPKRYVIRQKKPNRLRVLVNLDLIFGCSSTIYISRLVR